jgi:hypothetical protein
MLSNAKKSETHMFYLFLSFNYFSPDEQKYGYKSWTVSQLGGRVKSKQLTIIQMKTTYRSKNQRTIIYKTIGTIPLQRSLLCFGKDSTLNTVAIIYIRKA